MSDKETLDGLSKRDRRLLRAAAQAAEQAYRRGVHHGAYAMQKHLANGGDPKALTLDISAWRSQRRPYRAAVGPPGLINGYKTPVLHRFTMESGGRTFADLLRGDPTAIGR